MKNNIQIKNSGEIDLNKQKVNNFVLSGFNSNLQSTRC